MEDWKLKQQESAHATHIAKKLDDKREKKHKKQGKKLEVESFSFLFHCRMKGHLGRITTYLFVNAYDLVLSSSFFLIH